MGTENEARGACASLSASSSSRHVLISETMTYTHPDDIKDRSQDMRDWPEIRGPDIMFYLVQTGACDLFEAHSFMQRSMQHHRSPADFGKRLHHMAAMKPQVIHQPAAFDAAPFITIQSAGTSVDIGCKQYQSRK
ncbi:uncharacterized protein LOC144126298 [Amblyomma americanum]